MRKSFFLLILFLISPFIYAQGPEVLIPVPKNVTYSDKVYVFEDQPKIKTVIDKRNLSEEEYSIKISPKGITVKAGGEAGAFYAAQSIDMMTRGGKIKELKCCFIEDGPRFPYRGLHVDMSRHFRSVEFLKKQMDAMALFKMNRMHLHLTDAAGWRIQIDAYPRLTEFAAWRPQATWKEWWKGNRHYTEGTER